MYVVVDSKAQPSRFGIRAAPAAQITLEFESAGTEKRKSSKNVPQQTPKYVQIPLLYRNSLLGEKCKNWPSADIEHSTPRS